MPEWPTCTFGEMCEHSAFGPRFSSEEYDPNGNVACLRTMDMDFNGVINFEAMPIATLDLSRLQNHVLRPGDLVITRTGAYLGKAAVFTSFRLPVLPGAFSIRFRLKRAIVDPYFCRYFINSAQGQEATRALATGSAQPNLNIPNLHSLKLPLPPLEVQRQIVETLGSLDDKIEQNRRTVSKLEGLARAVFKAWFVDFEPVKAKAAGATAFPGMPPETFATLPSHFQETTLGTVPQGWEVKYAGELASFILGGDWGKDIATEETPDPAHCIRGADIPDLWANGLGKMPIRYLKSGSLQKRSLRPGDIAIEISGGSPTQSTGRPVLVTESLLSELQHPLVCSNFCRIFRPKQHYTNFTYFLLRWLYDAEQFLQYENGTTGIKNFAFTKFCEVHPVVTPHESLLTSFDTWIEPLMQAMAHAGRESRKLAALRDYLLPRLLSGRVRIEKATT